MILIHLMNQKILLVQDQYQSQQTVKVWVQRVSTDMVGKIYRYLAETNGFRISMRIQAMSSPRDFLMTQS